GAAARQAVEPGMGAAPGLRQEEGGDIEIAGGGELPGAFPLPGQGPQAPRLGLHLGQGLLGYGAQGGEVAAQVAVAVEAEARGNVLSLPLLPAVLLGVPLGNLSVVAGQGLVGGLGDPLLQRLEGEDAEQRVAAADLSIEE